MIKGNKDGIEFEMPADEEEAFWLDVKERSEKALNEDLPAEREMIEKQIKLQTEILNLAKNKLK